MGSPVSSVCFDFYLKFLFSLFADVDEGFRALSEQTNKADVKIRKKYTKTPSSPPAPPSVAPLSPNITAPNNVRQFSYSQAAQKQHKPTVAPPSQQKSILTKTKSMPNSPPPSVIRQLATTRTSPAHKMPHSNSVDSRRRLSSNESTASSTSTAPNYPPGFSIFSSPTSTAERASVTPPSPDVVGISEWTQFGQNSFNIAPGLLSSAPTHPTGMDSTVSRPNGRSRWDFTQRSPQPEAVWNPNRVFFPARGTPPVPGSPTTPTVLNHQDLWTSSTSTHAIWSVSNAVTMDEDRSVGSDPLGVSSIWSSSRRNNNNNQQYPPSSSYR